jgi:hypothetical protein
VLPLVEEAADVARLGGGELKPGDDTPGLGRVVVADRGFEVLAERLWLAELPAQPAQEAHPRRTGYRVETHTACRFVVTKPIRS